MKLHANSGHASATQLKRVLVDSDGGMSRLVNQAGQVLETCDACKAFDKAPHIPIAGTTTISAFDEKVQVDLLVLDNLVTLHAMDFFLRYSMLLPASSEKSLEAWDAYAESRNTTTRGRKHPFCSAS